jgi:hypothetical protein
MCAQQSHRLCRRTQKTPYALREFGSAGSDVVILLPLVGGRAIPLSAQPTTTTLVV